MAQTDRRFEQLKQKYQSVLTAIGQQQVRLQNLHVQEEKLFIRGEPGMVIVEGGWLELCRGLPNQTEVTVRGLHFLQEDSPDDVGGALATWVDLLSP